jgi:hypothetical protein
MPIRSAGGRQLRQPLFIHCVIGVLGVGPDVPGEPVEVEGDRNG